jgi:glycosyltransferase involved in cell wall biosynthesis
LRISVVTPHFPDPNGTASGRDLWSWCEGAIALGHELEAWVWNRPVYPPKNEAPAWCRYDPYDTVTGPMWREHLSSLVRPRWGLGAAGWAPPDGSVSVADHAVSYPAVAQAERSVVTLPYRSVADSYAVRDLRLSSIQDARSERRASRGAALTLAYSPRVARYLRREKRVVPVGYPVPSRSLVPVDAPVAALMADWLWPPNKLALSWLLAAWPSVREAVPTAELLLAGRSLDAAGVGSVPGVRLLGEVGSSTEVLSQAAVVAFPCPNSSGPKVKVLEALSYGLPVVTTPAGVEGLFAGDGAVVANLEGFAPALAALLGSAERRAALGASGRAAVEQHHSPQAAARARLDAFTEVFGVR